MDYTRPELADRLAAEYVSGLMRGPARRRFMMLLPAHPALRRAVRDWQARLMPLTAAAPVGGATAGAVQPASFVASISADGRAMVTRPLVNVSVEASRALELWALPPQGAPRSLGLIAADKATVVRRSQVLEGIAA